MKTPLSKQAVYSVISLACSISTLVGPLVYWLKEANKVKAESGIADFPLELLLLLHVFPTVHAMGFLSGLRSFWLQSNAIGIGLWAMIVSLLWLLFDFLIWLKWTS